MTSVSLCLCGKPHSHTPAIVSIASIESMKSIQPASGQAGPFSRGRTAILATPAAREPTMKRSVIPDLPPTVRRGIIKRVPGRFRRDVAQDSWVAHLRGADANVAMWKHFKRAARRETKVTCFSQLETEELDRIYSNEKKFLGHSS